MKSFYMELPENIWFGSLEHNKKAEAASAYLIFAADEPNMRRVAKQYLGEEISTRHDWDRAFGAQVQDLGDVFVQRDADAAARNFVKTVVGDFERFAAAIQGDLGSMQIVSIASAQTLSGPIRELRLEVREDAKTRVVYYGPNVASFNDVSRRVVVQEILKFF